MLHIESLQYSNAMRSLIFQCIGKWHFVRFWKLHYHCFWFWSLCLSSPLMSWLWCCYLTLMVALTLYVGWPFVSIFIVDYSAVSLLNSNGGEVGSFSCSTLYCCCCHSWNPVNVSTCHGCLQAYIKKFFCLGLKISEFTELFYVKFNSKC